MKRLTFTSLLLLLLCTFSTKALAYDIAVENEDGVTIYYNYINNRTELQVTYRYLSDASYSGEVVVPETVTISNETLKVTSIGDYAFYECRNLTLITIPKNVTSIGYAAFYYCSSLASLTIPNSVTSIGMFAFRSCISLTSITIPNSVTSIGYSVFSGCSSLTSITIPNSVTSIDADAFRSCISLTSITIPNSVISIGNDAFYGCNNLITIVSLIEEPFVISDNVFASVYSTATLYVPQGTRAKYEVTPSWKNFYHIEEGIPTGIMLPNVGSNGATEQQRYTLDGQRITAPQRGLNIVKMSDGTTRKVMTR